MLTRDSILTASDIQTRDVDVPEWGGTVRVRGLSGRARDAFELTLSEPGPDGDRVPSVANVRARLLIRCLVDEAGTRLFADTDAYALGEKAGNVLDRLFDVACELSGLDFAGDGSKAVKAAEGNSDGAPSAASTSSSPESSAAPSPNSSTGSAPLS